MDRATVDQLLTTTRTVRRRLDLNADNQWQLSENAAERYERVLVPAIFSRWAADLVALAGLRDAERVLDVACGTGVVARLAAQHVGSAGHVTGLDLNRGMLDVARTLPTARGAAPITWVEESALRTRLPEASFDVVLCQQGIQFFPDRLSALREMARVLTPGGRALLSVWEGPTPYTTAMWNAVERHIGLDAAITLRKSRSSEDPAVLRQIMIQAGFRRVELCRRAHTAKLPAVGDFVLRHLAATPVAGALDAAGDGVRRALAEDVHTALRPYADGDGIAFPNSVNVAIGVR
jgi:ubiquinone/menaquinone biosynthesis C-methylase UbiE